jgi:hypothetical protein
MLKTNDTVAVAGWNGIAFMVHEVNDDKVDVVMIGDDRHWHVDVDDCTPLNDGFCIDCGQIGCRSNEYN